MEKNRLEAFSDGVIAIIITIMVLEFKVPREPTFAALTPLLPVVLSYVLSYIYIGIYWSNHHHLLHATRHVTGGILWANLYLLFWLSLIPFVTSWMGEKHGAAAPTALYGFIMFMTGGAYWNLERLIVAKEGAGSRIGRAVGYNDSKAAFSLLFYGIGISAAFMWPLFSWVMYALVAGTWLIPDRRIEQIFAGEAKGEG